RVARGGDDAEDLLVLFGSLGPDVTHLREIAVDRARPIDLGPEIDQHQASFANLAIGPGDRRIVRVARVRSLADDRRMVRDAAVTLEVSEDGLLDLVLANAAALADGGDDRVPGDLERRLRDAIGLKVQIPLLVGEQGLEDLNQIARGDDLLA